MKILVLPCCRLSSSAIVQCYHAVDILKVFWEFVNTLLFKSKTNTFSLLLSIISILNAIVLTSVV